MKLLHAVSRAASAFKATYAAGPDSTGSYGYDPAYWWDFFRNGWAAVSNALGSFWGALRDWGGVTYQALAEDAAANPHAGRGLRLIATTAPPCRSSATAPARARTGSPPTWRCPTSPPSPPSGGPAGPTSGRPS